ncbi:MAG: helicase-exonuclease AddAB subunit AddB [Clostridia bacterium]|nr:helicase-exonuclease AddAB subunit AddB [Clostridia bacterium]
MEFKIVYGCSGSGKTTYIYNEIKEKIKKENKIYIIVPEQFSFSAENHLLNVIDGKSSVNAEVLTLSRMADRVISETVGNGKSHLSNIGKSMIIYDAIDSLKRNMYFLSGADKNLELASRMITEFKKHGVKADNLSNVSEKIDDKYLQLKIEDSKKILEKYQERIEENYIDESDSLEILADNIEMSNLFNDAVFYIDEFAGFTPNEYHVIDKLCTIASEITVTICTDSLENVENIDENLFYFNNLTAEKLLEIAKKNGCFIDRIKLGDSKRFNSEELLCLEKNIYRINEEKFNKQTSDISLFIAKNPESEVKNVAQEILKLVKNDKYRFKDIAVVCANIDNYSSDIKACFEKYGIPVFIDEKKDINNNILMKYIVSLLNIFTTNFSYEAMFSYIKCGILNISEDDIFTLENYINKWGIKGNKWYKEDFSFEEKNDIQDRMNIVRRRIIEPVLEFRKNLLKEKTAVEICESLYTFIEKNNIQENILNKAKVFEENGNIDVAEEYRNGIKLFFDVLDEIVLIFDNEKMSFERFNKILQIGISKSEFGKIPTFFDQVLFGDIDRSKTKDIKALFLLGLNDGVIPNVARDEGFFNDKDRKILKENNVELAKNSTELLYENQFNIYKVLSTPTNRLFLSYAVSDKDGRALRSSILITQIKRIFTNLLEDSDVIESKFMLTTKDATLDYAVEKYQEFVDDEEISQEWLDVIAWYEKNDKERISRIFRGARFTNIPEVISTENVKKLYGDTLRTSVSRLEQYRRCPFSFHMKYGLKLKEEDEFKIRSLDTGNFMHEVIDDVFEKIEEDELDLKNISKEELYLVVDEIINKKLGMSKNYIFSSSPKFIALTRRLKNVVYQSIDYIVEQIKNSKFELYGHEVEFSEKSEFKPMKIGLEDGKQVVVTGKIDRVDVAKIDDHSYVRIIDYKSSARDVDLNQVVAGIQIQLLTYLDEMTEQKNFESAGILYFGLLDTIVKANRNMSDEEIKKQLNKKFRMNGLVIADLEIIKMMDSRISPSNYSDSVPVYLDKEGNISKSKSSVLDREKFDRLQKYTKYVIKEISKEIFSGKVDIKPFYMNKKTPCEYCEYKSICNFDSKFKDNDYKYIKNYSKDFVVEEILKREN